MNFHLLFECGMRITDCGIPTGISRSLLFSFRWLTGRSDIVDFWKITVVFVEVNPVAHDEDIVHFFSEIFRLDLHLSPGLFIQEGTDLHRVRLRKGQPVLQKLKGPAAVDDVFNDEDIFSFDGKLNIFGDLNDAGGFHPGPITGQPDEIDLDRDLEEPPRYGPRPVVPTKLDPYKATIQARLDAYPKLSSVRLLEEMQA